VFNGWNTNNPRLDQTYEDIHGSLQTLTFYPSESGLVTMMPLLSSGLVSIGSHDITCNLNTMAQDASRIKHEEGPAPSHWSA
jgi:hypothetical protein